MSEPITDVIFRMIQKEVVAIFPGCCGTNQYDVTIYVHNGQHGSGQISYVVMGRLATEQEYAPLKRELESIGYKLRVIKRFTTKHKQQRAEEYARPLVSA